MKRMDTTSILSVTNALHHTNELRILIASFDNAYDTLHNFNKIENILWSTNIKNLKKNKY
jgi:hypothetical protein